MDMYIIAVEAMHPSRKYEELGETLSKHDLGQPCHVLSGVWCIMTNRTADDLYEFLVKTVVDPGDKFIVAPISKPWLSHNAISQAKCFDLNE